MDAARLIERLEAFPPALSALARTVATADQTWRREPGSWCLNEVLAHLADEEKEDFPLRLEHVLDRADGDFVPIDPEGWVQRRSYASRDAADSLSAFAKARSQTLERLRQRGAPGEIDWNLAHEHPRLGPLHAGDLLGALAAHDALHLRQLARLLHDLAERDAAPFHVSYAGWW